MLATGFGGMDIHMSFHNGKQKLPKIKLFLELRKIFQYCLINEMKNW